MPFNMSASGPMIYIGPGRLLITDLIGFVVWSFFIYCFYKKNIMNIEKQERALKGLYEFYRACTSGFFDFLKWLIILGVFEAAAIKAREASLYSLYALLDFIYATCMVLLLVYMVTYLDFPIRKLVFKMESIREKSKTRTILSYTMTGFVLIAASIMIAYVVQAISDMMVWITLGPGKS